MVQHVVYPESKYLQDAVDADLQMFFDEKLGLPGDKAQNHGHATSSSASAIPRIIPGVPETTVSPSIKAQPATLTLFFQELGLSRFEEPCRRLGIELYMIPLLKPEDFSAIGMTIGQRVVVLEAFKALEKEGLAPVAAPRSFARVRDALQSAANANVNQQQYRQQL